MQARVLCGAALGATLMIPTVALFHLAHVTLGLSFVPFDILDVTTRVLPGALLTRGIDTLVRVLQALGVEHTSSAAKLVEQSGALGGMIALAAMVGVIIGASGRRWAAWLPGLVVAMCLAPISVLMSDRSWMFRALDASWIAVGFVAWNVAARRACLTLLAPRDPSVVRLDRRRFVVQLGGAAAAVTLAGAALSWSVGRRRSSVRGTGVRWSSRHRLPNAADPMVPAPGTRDEFTPLEEHYRIDINSRAPVVDEASWRLKVTGLVDTERSLTLDELRRYEPLHQFVTLACISNPVGGDLIGTQRWTGVSLQDLLPELHLRSAATHLRFRAADGFDEVLALDEVSADPRIMLTYAWDDLPLSAEHGFPLRIYIPGRYGMKQPKWIVSIEALDHFEPGYWVRRGWDEAARMKATSVIDTVSVDDARGNVIPVGGIAHAGAKGISRVEVRADDGPWQKADLRAPLSSTTWVVWRFDWTFTPGAHTLTVRCVDGTGQPQPIEEAPPHPSGASGLHDFDVKV